MLLGISIENKRCYVRKLQADKGSNWWWWVLIFAVPYFLIYYFVFKNVILKRQLQTPGRELSEDEVMERDLSSGISTEILEGIISAIGGRDNIVSVDSCFTRVRLALKDVSLVEDDKVFKEQYNAKGVVRVGNGVQLVYGMQAELYKTGLAELVEETDGN